MLTTELVGVHIFNSVRKFIIHNSDSLSSGNCIT